MVKEVLGLQSVEGPFFEQTWEFESDGARWLLGSGPINFNFMNLHEDALNDQRGASYERPILAIT